MKTLIFGFSRPIDWKPYAAGIMWIDGIDFDHAYTRFDSDRWGVSFIYQSSGFRTNFTSKEAFEKINKIVEEYAIDVADDVEAAIGKLCVDREGKPYAIRQVFGKCFVRLVFVLSGGKLRIRNPLGADDAETDCIEEQSKILSKALGIEIPMDMDAVTVKPYHDWLVKLPQMKKIGVNT